MLGTGLGVYIPILLYVGFLIGCLLSIAWRPTIGLYILILVMPQQRLRSYISDLPLGKHIILLLLLAVLIGALMRGQSVRPSKLNKTLIVFVVFTFISLCWGALNPYLSSPILERLYHWKDYMMMPGFFFAASASIRTRKEFTTALVLVCLSVLLVGRSFALEIRQHDFSHFDESKRESGPLGLGSNNTAAFEAEMSLFLLALVGSLKKRSSKLLLYGIIALSVFCILFAFSRGAYIGFVAGLIALALIKRPILVPIVLVLLLAWQTVLPVAVVERITMTEDDSGQLEESAASRVELWKDAVDLIAANPIFGSGYDTYEYMGRIGSLRDTHNFYVKAMVETGFIGLLIFFLILGKFIQMGWTLFRRTQDSMFSSLGLGMVLCTICIAILNLFGDRWSYLELNGLVWVLFGLAAYAHYELDSVALAATQKTSVPEILAAFPGRTLSRV